MGKKALVTPSDEERSQIPVPAIGSRGQLDGQQQSLRQQKVTRSIERVLEDFISRSPLASVVDITEISLSKDLRNVTAFWQYDSVLSNSGSDQRFEGLGLKSAWIRRPPLSAEEKRIERWFEQNAVKIRFALTSRLRLKVRLLGLFLALD